MKGDGCLQKARNKRRVQASISRRPNTARKRRAAMWCEVSRPDKRVCLEASPGTAPEARMRSVILAVGGTLVCSGCVAQPPPMPVFSEVNTRVVAADPSCQDYTARASISGAQQEIAGRACQQPDGSWRHGRLPRSREPWLRELSWSLGHVSRLVWPQFSLRNELRTRECPTGLGRTDEQLRPQGKSRSSLRAPPRSSVSSRPLSA